MTEAIKRLKQVMAQLRDPLKGCPWDLQQNFQSIAPYTLEETYEVVEAIEQNDTSALKEELGDLLFQIAFHAQLGEEARLFTFDDIANGVTDKMIERHPHVFGDRKAHTAESVLSNWENDKAAKREAKAKNEKRALSALEGISTALPATTRAVKLQKRAARVGFDWAEAKEVLAKIREEMDELEAEMPLFDNHDAKEEELGDLFFAIINLARKLNVDPESALRRTNRKFEYRFREIEARLAMRNQTVTQTTLQEMEELWNVIKAEEKERKKAEA